MEMISTDELAAMKGVTASGVQCRILAARAKRAHNVTPLPEEIDVITDANRGIGLFAKGDRKPWPKYYEKGALLQWFDSESARRSFHRLKRRKV